MRTLHITVVILMCGSPFLLGQQMKYLQKENNRAYTGWE